MPLSSKLRADYAELINQQLDTIRIDTVEDFTLVQQALNNIIQPATYQVPEKYKEKIFGINDYLKDPGDYVQYESDYDEYKQIITDRIASKIDEFKSLSESQKREYIENQLPQRSQTAANQQTMAQRQPPQQGTDAHVLTENQWHAHMQQQFQHGNDPHPRQHVVSNAPNQQQASAITEEEIAAAVSAGIITLQQYLQIPSYERESMRPLFSTEGRETVTAGIITLQQYLEIPLHDRESMRHLFSTEGREAISSDIITLQQYLEIPLHDRKNQLDDLISGNQTHLTM